VATAASNAEDASKRGCSHLDSEEGPLQLARFRDTLLNKTGNPHSSLIDGPPMDGHFPWLGSGGLIRFRRSWPRRSRMVCPAMSSRLACVAWRHLAASGMSFMAAKTLELLGASAAGRLTYLADSFRGIPDQVAYKPAIQANVTLKHLSMQSGLDLHSHTYEILNNNNVQRVMKDAQAVGLDMSRLRFVEGYFNDSLPALIRAEPALQFAVVRLDGDTFFSTYEAIEILYPHLSPDGFLIVDDYLDWKTCRAAIDTYRTVHGIKEPIVAVPHNSTVEM
jgi:Macrocin-O-methyltransferase (TylF)